jgi:hypothetical protein
MFDSTMSAGGGCLPGVPTDSVSSGTEAGTVSGVAVESFGVVGAGTADCGTDPVLSVVGNVSVATDESPVRASCLIVNAVPTPVAATSMIAFA